MPRAPFCRSAVVVLAAMLLGAASPQEQLHPGPATMSSWSISPAVLATFIAHGDPETPEQVRERLATHTAPSGPVTLDVLILWRGEPGWFTHGALQKESGGGDSRGDVSFHLERGGIVLDAALDADTRVLHIGRTQVALGDANVVMVDRVDVPGGLAIAGTRTVGRRVQRPPEGVYEVFRGVPDVVPFLRCELAGTRSCTPIIQGK